ncbi:NOP5/NOP56 family protein [Natrialbaceae archaeon A-CW2]
MSGDGWFAGTQDERLERIRHGSAAKPANWPTLAVESASDIEDETTYYDRLHEATVSATRAAVQTRERADDNQLIHAIRSLEDCRRTANELAERLSEWGGTVDPEAGAGIDYAKQLVEEPPADGPEPMLSLAGRVVDLAHQAEELEAYVERQAPVVAPNLSALAGPVLAARLLSLAGSLESLAKKPSGTVQVLGAEEALFAHLRGHAPSPKHGIIFTHEAVRGTRLEDRGSAARALAGKLAIAARVDHYSGEYRPELEAEFEERMATIRARADEGDDKTENGDSHA